MPPGRPGSWEDALHHVLGVDALLVFNSDESEELLEPRGHRAVVVVYRPDIEAFGNYVPTILPRHYDALAYFDWTHALHPLNIAADVAHEVPETFPSGV